MEACIIKKSDTLGVRKYIISSNTKNRNWLKKESRGKVDPSWSFKEGDVPVEAWKFVGNNRKGFSPVNVPN